MGGEKSSLMDGTDFSKITDKVCTRQHSVNGPRHLLSKFVSSSNWWPICKVLFQRLRIILFVTITFYSLSGESFKAVGISSVFEVLYGPRHMLQRSCCVKDTSSHDINTDIIILQQCSNSRRNLPLPPLLVILKTLAGLKRLILVRVHRNCLAKWQLWSCSYRA